MVAVEGGAMRRLTAEEEAKFQYAVHLPCTKTAKPSPRSVRDTGHAKLPQRGEEETLVEFVLRFLRAYGLGQDNEGISHR